MHTAQDLIDYMTKVWNTPCSAQPDGSVICHTTPLYTTQRNARVVARSMGARRCWANKVASDIPGYTYELPNGERVVIAIDGSAIREIN